MTHNSEQHSEQRLEPPQRKRSRELADRVIVVTGAAGGIGRALCAQLGRQGGRLGLLDKDGASVRKLMEDLRQAGIACVAAEADVTDQEQMRRAVAEIESVLGPSDILVAAAGICGFCPPDEIMVDQLRQMLDVNVLGTVNAMAAVLPAMKSRGSGQIVALCSLAAVSNLPFENSYSASKAALAAYLRSMRGALRLHGIAVTIVHPGFVRTQLLLGLIAASHSRLPWATIEPQAAARQITNAILKRRRLVAFPLTTSLLAYGAAFLAPALYDRVMLWMSRRWGWR
jgi:short-subunit dehydrogenase